MKIKPHQRINKQTDSDKLQGVIRNPFAFYFAIRRGFSGSIQTLAYLMWLSIWEETHQDGSTGESTKPCQSQIIRLGFNAIPNEMAVLYTLPIASYTDGWGTHAFSEGNRTQA